MRFQNLAQMFLFWVAIWENQFDWEWSDPEFALRVSGPFLNQLSALDNNPAVHTIITATHFPILEEQIHRDDHKSGWAFSNAYAGNLTLGKQVLKIKK